MAGPTAVFHADFTKWDAALKNATTDLKRFEVVTGNVRQSLQRMVTGFEGTKIMQQAKLAVAAVNEIGGASKLTAAEQRKVNATVTEAIAKYKALGQSAPADLKKLQRETAGVNTAMAGIGSTVLKLGGLFAATFTVGALTRAAKAAIELGGELTDLSSRTGISTQALQEFRFAGGQVGVSMESITSAVGQMQKRLAGGDQSAVAALKHLGLSVKELRSLRPEDQFAAIAAKIKDIEDPAARAKLAMDVMGKGALETMPLLLSDLEQLRQKANDLGIVLDEETIAALDEMGDTVDALLLVGQALIANVLKPLAPHLKDVGGFALSAAGSVKSLSEALTFAQTTFTAVLMIAYKTAAAFTEIQVAALKFNRATNPLAAAFGFLDQQIADATAQAEQYRTTGNLLQQDIDNLIQNGLKPQAKALGDSTKATKPFIDISDEARRAAEAEAKAIRALADELSGAKMLGSITQLEKAWRSLSAAERADPIIQGRVIDKFIEMEAAVGDLPPHLQAFRVELTKVSATAKSLSFEKAYKSLAQFTKELAKTERANVLAQMAKDAAVLDKAILSNLAITRKANAEYDKTVREQGLSRTGFLISEVQRWEREEKATIDKSVGNWQAAFDATERVASQRINTIITESKELGLVFAQLGVLTGGIFGPIFIQNAENAAKTLEALGLKAEKTGTSFGQKLGKNLEEALGNIPQIITDGLIHDASFEDIAAAIGTQIGSAIGGAIGFALGGVLGEKIGEALGSLLGPLLDSLIQTRAEETQLRVRMEFGVAITEGLAQAIEDAAKELGGNREAAKLINLDKIISEGGGLTIQNIDEMFARLHDVFSLLETGALDAAQAQEVLNKNFKQFADFVTKDGALASKELLEIIRLNDRLGTQSAAVAEFVTAQVTTALGGLTTFLENAEVSSQAAAEGIAASVFGAFEALVKQGASPLEAIKQITPVLEKLDAQLKAAGFTGGAAFDSLRAMAALASDAVKGPMIEAITGLGVALEGLHNSGVLNQEMFAGLSTQITDTYNKLIAQGTDGAQALQLIGPSLQTIWELQQDFGYAVDAATQALLDQAEAAGVVGDEHRSVQEKMLLAVERTAEAVEALAKLFGAELPSQIDKTTDAVNKIPTNVKIKVNYDVERLPDPDRGPSGPISTDNPDRDPYRGGTYARGYANGGVVYAQHGMWAPRGTDTVPAMLTPGEVVLPREVVAALRSSSGGGAVTVNLSISAIDGADVERVVRSPEFRRALTSAVSGNVGGVRTDLRTAIGVR